MSGQVRYMTPSSRAPDPEMTFRSLYEHAYPDVLRFIQRRMDPHHAEDVAAETFMTVWRRLGELPADHDDARAWLFGIARHVIQNQQRGQRRRHALGIRLANHPVTEASSADMDHIALLADLARVWNQLSEVHQEALGLAVFEDLSAPQAARVLGISPVAYRLRLSRARRALRLFLNHPADRAPAPAALPEGTPS